MRILLRTLRLIVAVAAAFLMASVANAVVNVDISTSSPTTNLMVSRPATHTTFLRGVWMVGSRHGMQA